MTDRRLTSVRVGSAGEHLVMETYADGATVIQLVEEDGRQSGGARILPDGLVTMGEAILRRARAQAPLSDPLLRRAVAQLLRLFPDRPLGGANLFELALGLVDELAGVDLRRDVAAMTDELEAWQDERAKDLDREYEASAMARSTLAGLSPRGEDLDRVLRWALERLMAAHEGGGTAVLVEARAETGIGLEAFWLSDRGRR